MRSLLADARHAARVLARAPGFTLVVVLTLALGIGFNAAIFSVTNAVLLRPLPFQEPDRLAVLWETRLDQGENIMFASPPNYADWRDRSTAFQEIAAFAPGSFFVLGDEETIHVPGARVSANLFRTLGVSPLLGRGFDEAEDEPGASRVAVISHALWQARFGGAPDVIGSAIELDDGRYTVVGVMPPGFSFPPAIDLHGRTAARRTDIWVPFGFDPAAANRGAHYMTVVGRLAPGATRAAAEAELNRIAADLAREYPATNEGWGVRVVSFERVMVGEARTALLVLLGAVGAVLLIACANVANLLLARSTGRQKEYAIRAALGAGRWPLVRQAIVESQLLALAGGTVGLLLAVAGTRALVLAAPADVPRLDEAGVDAVVVGYALALSLLTGLLFGLAPALRTFAGDLHRLLGAGARGSGGDGGRLRNALVVAEVALSLVLFAAGGLLFRSFLALRGVETGIRAENVLTLRVTLPADRYRERARIVGAFREMEERVRALPGVEAAGFIATVPLAEDFQGSIVEIEELPPPAQGELRIAHFAVVTPGYFEAMGIPVVDGRAFGPEDGPDAGGTILINEALARAYLDGRDPIGLRVTSFGDPRRIVGVVGDVRLETLEDDPMPAMYLPHAQVPWAERSLSLVVRTRGAPEAALAPVRQELRAVERGAAIHQVRTMDQILADRLAQPRFAALVLLLFSGLALTLAAVGIYGVISYAVGRRTREIGIRMALGARATGILSLVLGQGMRLVGAGVVLGLAGAVVGGRYIESLLFGVRPLDPLVLGGVTAFLVVVGLLACWLPARRASRIDPVKALRYE